MSDELGRGMTRLEETPADLDIWRAANLLIEQHGPRAIVEATKREIELLQSGEQQGAAMWRRIISAINKLMSEKPADKMN